MVRYLLGTFFIVDGEKYRRLWYFSLPERIGFGLSRDGTTGSWNLELRCYLSISSIVPKLIMADLHK